VQEIECRPRDEEEGRFCYRI